VITACGSIREPSASTTPVSSSDSTPATISMRRALIASMTSRSTIAGGTPSRFRRVKRPSSGIGRPYSVRSPISRRRTFRMIASARPVPSLRIVLASSGPIGLRMMMFGGVRTASRTRAAPSEASSYAISVPEHPGPTTSTSRPRKWSAFRYSAEWISVWRNASRPGHDGMYGVWE
jgi:hypothetical protein